MEARSSGKSSALLSSICAKEKEAALDKGPPGDRNAKQLLCYQWLIFVLRLLGHSGSALIFEEEFFLIPPPGLRYPRQGRSASPRCNRSITEKFNDMSELHPVGAGDGG